MKLFVIQDRLRENSNEIACDLLEDKEGRITLGNFLIFTSEEEAQVKCASLKEKFNFTHEYEVIPINTFN